jgi:hypothetical protein
MMSEQMRRRAQQLDELSGRLTEPRAVDLAQRGLMAQGDV